MEYKVDSYKRVLVTSNKGFGRYGDTRNWVKLTKSKGEYFIELNKVKVNVKELKQLEDHKHSNGKYFDENGKEVETFTITSQFYFEQ
jgi:hypothetical protein